MKHSSLSFFCMGLCTTSQKTVPCRVSGISGVEISTSMVSPPNSCDSLPCLISGVSSIGELVISNSVLSALSPSGHRLWSPFPFFSGEFLIILLDYPKIELSFLTSPSRLSDSSPLPVIGTCVLAWLHTGDAVQSLNIDRVWLALQPGTPTGTGVCNPCTVNFFFIVFHH